MTQPPSTPAQRREHAGEQAIAVAVGMIAASEGYSSVATRRWRRGKTMTGPAWVYLVAWFGLWVAWFAHVRSGTESGATALSLVGVATVLCVVVGAVTWVGWMVGVASWESLVWLGHTDGQLTANRVGRWLTIDECRANKAALEAGLHLAVPNLVISGLLAAAGDGGVLLGSDLAVVYTNYAQPWLQWNQAEAQLAAGQPVWFDSPPPPGQTMAVIGPFIRGGVVVAVVGLWIGCLIDLPATGSLAATLIAGLGTVIVLRHRIRHAITSVTGNK